MVVFKFKLEIELRERFIEVVALIVIINNTSKCAFGKTSSLETNSAVTHISTPLFTKKPSLKSRETLLPKRAKTLESVRLRFPHSFLANNDEDGGELAKDSATVVDIQDSFHLKEAELSKKEVITMIKAFLKRTKGHLDAKNPERTKPFMTGCTQFVKYINENFDEMQVFTGESYDFEASLVFSMMKEQTDSGPTFWYFHDALLEEKF